MINLCINVLTKLGSWIMDLIIWKKEKVDPLVSKYFYNPLCHFFDPKLNYPISIVKDGQIINKYKNIDQIDEVNFDLIIKKENNQNLIIHDIQDYRPSNIEKPAYTIMSMVLLMNNQQYEILLKKPNDYMIIKNVLNAAFFKYYMKQQYNKIIEDSYKIQFIDHKMSFKECDSTKSILISKEGLVIQ